MRYRLRAILLASLALATLVRAGEPAKEKPVVNPPPTAQDWADLAKLPDWSGVWNPKVTDQDAQIRTNPPPWNAKAAAEAAALFPEGEAGRPPLIFHRCLPAPLPARVLGPNNRS